MFLPVVCLCNGQSDSRSGCETGGTETAAAAQCSVPSNLYLFNFPLLHLICLPNILQALLEMGFLCTAAYQKQPWKPDCFERCDTVIWEL